MSWEVLEELDTGGNVPSDSPLPRSSAKIPGGRYRLAAYLNEELAASLFAKAMDTGLSLSAQAEREIASSLDFQLPELEDDRRTSEMEKVRRSYERNSKCESER